MKVNEIFYSLQGEGHFTGTPAVFLRFSGCNLRCPFCDTLHEPFRDMSAPEILDELLRYPSRHLVVTGGEPSLQLDEAFVDMLHSAGFFVQVETNGVRSLPRNVDWITCSPKDAPVAYGEVDELKCLFHGPQSRQTLLNLASAVKAGYYYAQPCDVKDRDLNAGIVSDCIRFIKENPRWRLSLQTHKLLDIR